MGFLRTAGLAALSLAAALPAMAHVAADPREAPAGAYQAVAFRVGHGCGQAATTAIRIEIPETMASARPQPKPGWALTIEKDGERVTAIVWRGALPGDQFDDFAILFKLPAEPGALYFPTVQSCGEAENQWTEVPAAGESASDPAPALTILPAAKAAPAHNH
jgi:hypothetical protein